MRNFNKRWLLLIPLILLLAVSGFVIWASTPSGATMPEALAALQTSADVTVTDQDWLIFTPTDAEPETLFVFYPGGRVLAEAYAPMASRLADAGVLVVLVPMPLNLAILDINAADRVIAAYPDISYRAIGGHSLGGSMAANYVKSHPDVIQGLALLAAYPQASDTLADRADLAVVSISGTLDGLATPDKIADSRQYLPADAVYIPIDGGNHAQFGWYGDQAGDNPATISREAQQDQVVDALLTLFETMRG